MILLGQIIMTFGKICRVKENIVTKILAIQLSRNVTKFVQLDEFSNLLGGFSLFSLGFIIHASTVNTQELCLSLHEPMLWSHSIVLS